MIMETFAALLRGINIGGNNVIAMKDLKLAFEELKLSDVKTYIASGNVLFCSAEKDKTKLTRRIEKKLLESFKSNLRLTLVSFGEYKKIIEKAPPGFGEEKETYRYDVWFLFDGLDAKEVLQAIKPKEGVDTIAAGPGVVYVSRLVSMAGKSRLVRVNQMPMYQNITVRSWNTARKLLELMESGDLCL